MLGFEILFEPEPSLDSVFKFSPSPSLEPRLGSKMLGSARLGLGLDSLWAEYRTTIVPYFVNSLNANVIFISGAMYR